jgi:uncharacterized membrane protein
MTTKTETAKTNRQSPGIALIGVVLLALSIIGTGISSYLVYVHFAKLNPVCLPFAKCEVVLTSRYAEMWGVPLSLLGLLMYIGLVVLSLWLLQKRNENKGLAAIGIYTMALAGTMFSLYLLYLEAYVIHDYCTWCLASGIVILTILILSLVNLSAMGLNLGGLPRYVRVRVRRYIRW